MFFFICMQSTSSINLHIVNPQAPSRRMSRNLIDLKEDVGYREALAYRNCRRIPTNPPAQYEGKKKSW